MLRCREGPWEWLSRCPESAHVRAASPRVTADCTSAAVLERTVREKPGSPSERPPFLVLCNVRRLGAPRPRQGSRRVLEAGDDGGTERPHRAQRESLTLRLSGRAANGYFFSFKSELNR